MTPGASLPRPGFPQRAGDWVAPLPSILGRTAAVASDRCFLQSTKSHGPGPLPPPSAPGKPQTQSCTLLPGRCLSGLAELTPKCPQGRELRRADRCEEGGGALPPDTDTEEPWWGHLVAPREAKGGVSL